MLNTTISMCWINTLYGPYKQTFVALYATAHVWSKHEIKAKIFLSKHWVTSPNHRPQHSRTRLFSMHFKVWVKPFWLKPSCLTWIMSSRKQNPQNMQSLPRGHWIVAELLFFEILQIHLFVLWFGCLQRNLSPKASCLMSHERLEETE